MSGTVDALDRIETIISDEGMTLEQLIQRLGHRNSSLLKLSSSNLERYRNLYDEIASMDYPKALKGKKLEELTALLFESGGLFDLRKNCRTSTNEIDLMLTWNKTARDAGIGPAFPCFGNRFICECKNYSGKVSVTYVGKFYSLLAVSRVKFGVLVAWEGITGRGKWHDASGFIKKVALKDSTSIVTLDKNDLRRLYDGNCNVYAILQDKYDALMDDIDYSKYISPHDAEKHFACNNI